MRNLDVFTRKCSLRYVLAALLYTFCTVAALQAQQLPSFVFSEDFTTPKGQFKPAVAPWQPSAPLEGDVLFSETFDRTPAGWQMHGGAWTFGEGVAVANDAAKTSSVLISPDVTLGEGHYKLRYQEKYALESDHDFGSVWITTDSGQQWKKIHTVSGVADQHTTYIDLNAYRQQTISLAFVLDTDASVSGEGWTLDELEIVSLDQAAARRAMPASQARVRAAAAQQASFTPTLTSFSAQNFPLIYATVQVDGTPILSQSNFTVCENGIVQTDLFEVIPPEEGSLRPVDIIFVVDNSGSMGDEQAAVANTVDDFVNDLFASGVNAALGLTRFGQSAQFGEPIVEENGSLITDPDVFLNNVFTRNTEDGGYEPGLDAILASVSQFNFRPGSQKIFILITDEDNDGALEAADVLPALQQNTITLYAIIDQSFVASQEDYGDLAQATGGLQFDIEDLADPNTLMPIISSITTEVASNYAIRYRSSDPVFNGVTRIVDIKISYGGETDTLTTQYTPGAAPQVSLTTDTRNLLTQSFPIGTAFTIETEITDLLAPFVQSATLFYRTTGNAPYQSVSMTNTSGDMWQGVIPGSVANEPGVDFYITATDGNTTSSDRAFNPAENPYQIAINPNTAPQITHVPVTVLNLGDALEVEATILDNTQQVDEAYLYYRSVGELLYQQVMLNSSGDTYTATVGATNFSTDGVEYYIKATDNFGISSYAGEPDNPYQVVIGDQPGEQPEMLSFTLVNADTDTDIQPIQEGDIIDIAALTNVMFTITAAADPDETGSLAFRLEGPFIHGHTENFAPYALFGDIAGNYAGRIMPPGDYMLTATPYDEANGGGTVGTPATVNFTIVNSADIPADFAVTGFDLYDAVTDQKIQDLTEGTQINLANLANDELTVVISTMPNFVGSIILELDGPVSVDRMENTKPYTLFRNNNTNLFGETLTPGSYTLTATPYTEANGQGDMGTPLEVNFSVIDGNAAARIGQEQEGEKKGTLNGSSPLDVAAAFSAYPVPFRDQLFIKGAEDLPWFDVQVFGLDGKSWKIAVSQEPGGVRISPQEWLPTGMYMIRISSDNQLVKSLKVIKE